MRSKTGVVLLGSRQLEFREYPVPDPGPGPAPARPNGSTPAHDAVGIELRFDPPPIAEHLFGQTVEPT